jgi:hypothetical protein
VSSTCVQRTIEATYRHLLLSSRRRLGTWFQIRAVLTAQPQSQERLRTCDAMPFPTHPRDVFASSHIASLDSAGSTSRATPDPSQHPTRMGHHDRPSGSNSFPLAKKREHMTSTIHGSLATQQTEKQIGKLDPQPACVQRTNRLMPRCQCAGPQY